MAIDAPRHSQWLLSCNSIHGFHWAVALLAFEARLDMSFVCEMHKIRNVVDLDPGDRPLVGIILRDLDDLGFVSGDRLVATHAFFHRWHTGRWRTSCIDMTILTGNFIFPGMDSMTEFDGLNRAGVAKISVVYPDSPDKTGQSDKDNQSRLLKILKSFQNRN